MTTGPVHPKWTTTCSIFSLPQSDTPDMPTACLVYWCAQITITFRLITKLRHVTIVFIHHVIAGPEDAFTWFSPTSELVESVFCTKMFVLSPGWICPDYIQFLKNMYFVTTQRLPNILPWGSWADSVHLDSQHPQTLASVQGHCDRAQLLEPHWYQPAGAVGEWLVGVCCYVVM